MKKTQTAKDIIALVLGGIDSSVMMQVHGLTFNALE